MYLPLTPPVWETTSDRDSVADSSQVGDKDVGWVWGGIPRDRRLQARSPRPQFRIRALHRNGKQLTGQHVRNGQSTVDYLARSSTPSTLRSTLSTLCGGKAVIESTHAQRAAGGCSLAAQQIIVLRQRRVCGRRSCNRFLARIWPGTRKQPGGGGLFRVATRDPEQGVFAQRAVA